MPSFEQFVIVDIDTTGFDNDDEVVQLAAKCGPHEFSVLRVPHIGFDPRASEQNGFELDDGRLYRHGKRVSTVPGLAACYKFLAFLAERDHPVTLVGHNIRSFGYRFILRLFRHYGLENQFLKLVDSVSDTMPLLRQGNIQCKEELFQRNLRGPKWYDLLDDRADSLRDCKLLHGLIKKLRISNQEIADNSHSLPSY